MAGSLHSVDSVLLISRSDPWERLLIDIGLLPVLRLASIRVVLSSRPNVPPWFLVSRWLGLSLSLDLVLLLVLLHELEALSILHCRPVLKSNITTLFDNYHDGSLMLLVVESNISGVQFENLSQLVRDVSPHHLIPAVLDPDLKQSLFGPQRQTQSNDFWLLKLFA
jgi:hypothetical protein